MRKTAIFSFDGDSGSITDQFANLEIQGLRVEDLWVPLDLMTNKMLGVKSIDLVDSKSLSCKEAQLQILQNKFTL